MTRNNSNAIQIAVVVGLAMGIFTLGLSQASDWPRNIYGALMVGLVTGGVTYRSLYKRG